MLEFPGPGVAGDARRSVIAEGRSNGRVIMAGKRGGGENGPALEATQVKSLRSVGKGEVVCVGGVCSGGVGRGIGRSGKGKGDPGRGAAPWGRGGKVKGPRGGKDDLAYRPACQKGEKGW